MSKEDLINYPKHYARGEIEPIQVIESAGFGVGFCTGNVIKYVARHPYKGEPEQDLNKAAWYLSRLRTYKEVPEDLKGLLEDVGYLLQKNLDLFKGTLILEHEQYSLGIDTND